MRIRKPVRMPGPTRTTSAPVTVRAAASTSPVRPGTTEERMHPSTAPRSSPWSRSRS